MFAHRQPDACQGRGRCRNFDYTLSEGSTTRALTFSHMGARTGLMAAQGGNLTPNSGMLLNPHVSNLLGTGQGAARVQQQPSNRMVGMGMEMGRMQGAGAGRYV